MNNIYVFIVVGTVFFVQWAGRTLTYQLLCWGIGEQFAFSYDTLYTGIGVIHHEFAHAIIAILTGAKLTMFHPFKIFKYNEEGTLGEVGYYTRGGPIMRSMQGLLIGIAPSVLGSLTSLAIIFILYQRYLAVGWAFLKNWTSILLLFIAYQIIYHACPSKVDIKNARKGILLMIIALLFFWEPNINIDILNLWLAGTTLIVFASMTIPIIIIVIHKMRPRKPTVKDR